LVVLFSEHDDEDCFFYFKSSLVLLIKSLCISIPCEFEFSVLDGIDPIRTTYGLTVPRSDQLKAFHRICSCGNEAIRRSNINEILTRQTCGQRSRMSAGSKCRALPFYFSIRICIMFLTTNRRVESDVGPCMISVLAKRIPLPGGDFQL